MTVQCSSICKLINLDVVQVTWSAPGPWFNIKMSSYQYRKSHCGDKTILWHLYIESGPRLLSAGSTNVDFIIVNWNLQMQISSQFKQFLVMKIIHLKLLSKAQYVNVSVVRWTHVTLKSSGMILTWWQVMILSHGAMNIRFPCLGCCWKLTIYQWLLHKTAVTPLLMHWIYCSLLLSHQIGLGLCRYLNTGPFTNCNWHRLGLDKWLHSAVLTGVWSVIHALTWMVV